MDEQTTLEREAAAEAPDRAPAPPPDSPVREGKPVWLAPAAWILVLVVGLYFFEPLSTVLMGVLAACIIACTLRPLMSYIPGPRGMDVAVLSLGLVAVAAVIVFLIAWPFQAPLSDALIKWPETRRDVNEALAKWSADVGLADPPTVEKLMAGAGRYLTGAGGGAIFSQTADMVLGILLSLVFMLIGSIFLLTEPAAALTGPISRLLAPKHRGALKAAFIDLANRFRAWVLGTMTGMSVVFTASVIGYQIIGLRMAVPLALLAGFAEIVPTIGPAIACVIAVLVAAATQSGAMALGVLIVYAIVQSIEAYVILPMIMRGAVNIHPAVTLFSVVLWGKIFGVPGLMMAIPINLTIWTLLDHFYMRRLGGVAIEE